LRGGLQDLRDRHGRIAFVPTMGAVHAGHRHLCRVAGRHANGVVASIFVNPAQFAPHEDFDRYPRRFETDCQALGEEGVDLIYAPTREAMYPAGFDTRVQCPGLDSDLEALHRPHFFTGVATVVTKLFARVRPDAAVFGEKDYQQLLIVKRLAEDLDTGVHIIGGETVREADGLALSSRNEHLSHSARAKAPGLYRAMVKARLNLRGGDAVASVEARMQAEITAAGFDSIDYVAVRHAGTLQPLTTSALSSEPARILVAARIEGVRLIDNLAV
jgi:pantoate--beta-alanine ligase